MTPNGQPPNPAQQSSKSSNGWVVQPMFFAALSLAGGIFAGTYLWRPVFLWLLVFTIFAAAALTFFMDYPRIAFLCALVCLFALGAILVQLSATTGKVPPNLKLLTQDREVMVTGHIVRSGLIRNIGTTHTQFGEKLDQRETIDLESEEMVVDGVPQTVSIGVRVNLHLSVDVEPAGESPPDFGDQSDHLPAAMPPFSYGDRIRFPARLREPRNYGNPGAMDYRGYLYDQGIFLLASAKADKVEKLPGFVGDGFGTLRSRMRASLVAHMLAFASAKPTNGISRWFVMDEEDAGLLAAMIIGEQSLLQRDIKTDFQRTGTFHILVVSGMNVAILALVIFWLCRRFRAGEIPATIITVVLSLLYAYVTDLGAPILRAAIMLSLYLCARLLYRARFSLNSIGTAAFLLLAASPKSLYDASFQLTFLSVVVLGGITQPVLEKTSLPVRSALFGLHMLNYDATLAPPLAQFRLDLRLVIGRLADLWSVDWLRPFLPKHIDLKTWPRAVTEWAAVSSLRILLVAYELVLVTSIMQVALALPMSFYFHRMALLGLPTNMVVIPLTEILMPVALIASLLSYVSVLLAKIPVLLTALTVNAITETVRHLGGLRFAEVRVAIPSHAISLIAAASFAFCMIAVRRRRWLAVTGIAALFFAALLLTLPPKPQLRTGVAEVTAIDVGQGDSILIVSPDGRTLLIDGGGPAGFVHADLFDTGEDVVSPYLWSRGITRLDAIALTHAHTDHLGGLHAVMANFRPREFWIGMDSRSAGFRALMAQAKSQGVVVVHHHEGDSFVFGLLHLRVVGPAAQMEGIDEQQSRQKGRNDTSLALELRFGNTSALLTGDAEKLEERAIAAQVSHEDLLKVAHHGSGTSTTPELLAAARPEFAVISVGYRNLYHHPKQEVIGRLTAAGVRTYRTDSFGAITFYLDGIRVTPSVAAAPR